jgi:hypothetical protein
MLGLRWGWPERARARKIDIIANDFVAQSGVAGGEKAKWRMRIENYRNLCNWVRRNAWRVELSKQAAGDERPREINY